MTKFMILAEAFKLFAEKGYDATSMDDIAKAVGIKKASLYAHFPGKESIFAQVYADMVVDYSDHLSGLISRHKGKPLETMLFDIFTGYAAYFTEDLTKQSFWTRAYLFPPPFHKEVVVQECLRVEMEFVEKLTGIFEQGIADGVIRNGNAGDMVLAFYFMMAGYAMIAGYFQGPDITDNLKGSWEVFWRGVKA